MMAEKMDFSASLSDVEVDSSDSEGSIDGESVQTEDSGFQSSKKPKKGKKKKKMKKRPKKKTKPIVKIADIIEEVSEDGEQTPHYSRKVSRKFTGKQSLGEGTPKINRKSSSLKQIVDWLASANTKKEVPAVKEPSLPKAHYREQTTFDLINKIEGLHTHNLDTGTNLGATSSF